MKHLTIQLIVITLASIASSSCSSMEDAVIQNPYISNLENTGCISHWDTDNTKSRSEDNNGSFEMLFEGQLSRCKCICLRVTHHQILQQRLREWSLAYTLSDLVRFQRSGRRFRYFSRGVAGFHEAHRFKISEMYSMTLMPLSRHETTSDRYMAAV